MCERPRRRCEPISCPNASSAARNGACASGPFAAGGETPHMESPAPPLPTFLIIGAQKSATRWLRLNLGLHPAVFAASREIEFFNNRDRFQQQGIAWYREQFEGWNGEGIVGEATPGYMFWRHHPDVVAGRIDETLPGVRLIATLRNPIDRAQSALVHHIEYKTLPPDAVLLEHVRATPPEKDKLGIIVGGLYGASLA